MRRIAHEIPDLVHEGHLRKAVHYLFPDEYTFANSRSEVKNPTTGFFFELDVWLPNLCIGFEFQDIHHYITTWYYHKPVPTVKQRDDSKSEELQRMGGTLIQVPCWWDAKWESLAATIQFHRPDLLPKPSRRRMAIPLNPPRSYFNKRLITGMGELMHASFPLTATADTIFATSHFWWLGEKYDGVRCLWNSENSTLFARSGVEVQLPSKMMLFLPSFHLESEAWFGRGMYGEVQQLTLLEEDAINWANLRFVAFDTPLVLSQLPFEKRYLRILRSVGSANPFISVAMRVSCFSKTQLIGMLQQVIDDEGEGVVLRKPRSLYEPGRSTSLLKFKSTRADKEALVLEANSKDVLLKLPNGVKFSAPRELFRFTPSNGDLVTFSYDHSSKNDIPINPIFYRTRTDISWDDVVRDYIVSGSQKQNLNEVAREILNDPQKPSRYWSADKGHMRAHLETIALEKDLDPLNPESWYSLSRTDMLVEHKGLATISKMYKGGVIMALLDLFPDIGLDESKFDILRSNYWVDVKNRKEFFKSFAAEDGFDPLLADNWHTLPKDNLRLRKAMHSLMNCYKGSHVRALIHLFPDIGLDAKQFLPNTYWPDTAERRELFLQFAATKSFDPLLASNWYQIPLGDVLSQKGSYLVLHYYRHNLPRALILLFPTIGLIFSKFEKQNYWHVKRNRRNFFKDFASSHGFHYTDEEKWFNVIVEDLLSVNVQDAHNVMNIYSGRIDKALIDVFPELRLESNKFICNYFWGDIKNQADFFHQVAAKHKLNPLAPADWYSLDVETILESKGGHTILSFYNGSHAKAIMRAFPHIGLDIVKFSQRLRSYWTVPENQKQFFFDIAKDKGFDPLIAKNWYPLTATKILEYKGGGCVLAYHGGNLANSLTAVFPNIGLDRLMFSFWLNARHRKPTTSHPVAMRSSQTPI